MTGTWQTRVVRWIVDGNNVMGSRPDRWWNDRPAAMARLIQEIAEWCWTHADPVLVVFDGQTIESVAELSGGNLEVRFAQHSSRNAADDVIVEEARRQPSPLTVVTADKGLKARLPSAVRPEGPSTFLARLTPSS
jgi:predicted RNA-binding protein with PIN domain